MLVGRRLRSSDRVAFEARLRESMAHAGEDWTGVAAGWGASSVLVGVGDAAEAQAFYVRVGFRDMANRLFVRPLPD